MGNGAGRSGVRLVRSFLLPLALLMVVMQPERPDITRRGDALMVRMPGEVLGEKKVARQLETALTTTFLLEVRTERSVSDIAEIRVRYDLWDEEFVVTRQGFDGQVDSSKLPSAAKLAEWWNEPIPLPDSIATGDVVEIDLVVLPFSLEDQDQARDWLARSGGVSSDRTQSRGIVEALIGTTLRARPLARHQWKVRLVEERP